MILADIGAALLGTSVSDIQAQAADAEQKLTVAIGTMIGLEAIIALELFLLIVMAWKERH